MIRIVIACKEILFYMCDSGGVLLKILKYFEVMLNISEFYRMREIVES